MDTPVAGAPTTAALSVPLLDCARKDRSSFRAAIAVVDVLLRSPLAALVVTGEKPLVLTAPSFVNADDAAAVLARHVTGDCAAPQDAPMVAEAVNDVHPLVVEAMRAGRSHCVALYDDQARTWGTLCVVDLEGESPLAETVIQAIDDVAQAVAERLVTRYRESRRSAHEARFRNIAATSPDPIMCVDSSGITTFWNRAAEELFGYSAADMVGTPLVRIIPEDNRGEFFSDIERAAAALAGAPLDQRVRAEGRRRDGSIVQVELSLSSWLEGGEVAVGAIVRDLTERLNAEQRLYRLASTDSLTGLENRAAVHEALERGVASSTPLTFLMLDLDGFKEVNDTLGHSVGDDVLAMVASRISDSMTGASCVGRLGGDEFAIVLDGDHAANALARGTELVRAVSGQYRAKGHRVDIGASIGIAQYPRDAPNAEMLVSAADLALYSAKARGRDQIRVYEPALRRGAVEQHTLRQELRTAFHEKQFELVYQPQWGRDGMTLVGAEALLRWNHPTRGQLGPGDFIAALALKPIAPAVGEWVMRSACEQAVRWREVVPDFRVAVNLFESQLRGGHLVDSVARILDETGLPGTALELELVETIVTRDDEETARVLAALRELGVHLAFDDYGTGYASLSLLKRYPVSRLKIDRTFVHGVDTDDANGAVVMAVLYLASMFGLEVTAEGIETEAELAFLRAANCTYFQGYFLGRPMPVPAFEEACFPSAPTV